MGRSDLNHNDSPQKPDSPCTRCTDKTCLKTGKPCARVEAMLPKPRHGAARREHLVGLDVHGHGRDVRKGVIAYRRQVIDLLRRHGKTREAKIVEKYFWEGLTQAQIAEALGISQQAVSKVITKMEEIWL